MKKFDKLLSERKIVLLDSAMGTRLQELGLDSGNECGELWNLGENRAKVEQVHRENIEAGSDIVTTNTFGANTLKMAHYGLVDKILEINKSAAEAAVSAASGRALVAGDFGPTGEILDQWGGSRSADEIIAAYEPQVEGLVQGGVDLFILETFMDVEELLLALKAIRSKSDLPVIASMTYQKNAGEIRTMWGMTPAEVAARLSSEGVNGIGANCGLGSAEMVEIVKSYSDSTTLPVVAQPNAGLPEVVDGKTIYGESPSQMASRARELAAAGAKIIGGCCGSTPEYIGECKKILS